MTSWFSDKPLWKVHKHDSMKRFFWLIIVRSVHAKRKADLNHFGYLIMLYELRNS